MPGGICGEPPEHVGYLVPRKVRAFMCFPRPYHPVDLQFSAYYLRILPKRVSIMGKKELQYMPVLGQFMSLSGAVFVDRGNNAAAVRSLAAAGETIRTRHTSLWMFPEGTRTLRPDHDMKTFKKGAFHMAVEAGVPIVPVVCENYWNLYRKGIFEEGTMKVKGMLSSSAFNLAS